VCAVCTRAATLPRVLPPLPPPLPLCPPKQVIDGIVTPDGKQGLTLLAGLNTHCHADHITGTAELKQRMSQTSAFADCSNWMRPLSCWLSALTTGTAGQRRRRLQVKSMISKAAGAKADVLLEAGQRVYFGKRWVEVLATPGHTEGCLSFVLDDRSMVFTGDALLIGACGRSDFQGGSAVTLFKSVRGQLFTLPPECIVYPAHDYNGRPCSTVLAERLTNPRLGDAKSEEQFIEIMAALNLPYPKKIDASLPANLLCGYPDEASWVAAKP